MANNIVLSSGVRQNLLALQTTAHLMSITQNRLATGKKVNNALDNPGNFFTSNSLNNRAGDLEALLDSIGQAHQTLRAADAGLTSLTRLVESAKSIVKNAQQAPGPGSTTYNAFTVVGADPPNETLGSTSGAGAYGGAATAGDAGNLVIDMGGTDYTVALLDTDTLATFVTRFNSTAGLNTRVVASDNGGTLRLTALNADDFNVDAASTAASLTKLQLTVGQTATSTSLLENIGTSGTTLTIQVNGGSNNVITFGTGAGQVSTFLEFQNAINSISGLSGSATSTGVGFTIASTTTVQNSLALTHSHAALSAALGTTDGTTQGTATVGAPSAIRTSLESDYNNVLSQIDAMTTDASYNGVNLLNGDDFKVLFNETGTSSLTITGVVFDSAGLGLAAIGAGTFQADGNLDIEIGKLDGALSQLRTQASKFGSNLTTVQTRQEFTKNMIAALKTGADNLVLADTNEEGANLLALQTRQQLSTTALTLSAQADTAVLRLFGF
jgi:flagellin-like hook-associated protein FlgL